MSDRYDKEALLRYINDVLVERTPDKESALAAAFAIVDVFLGKDIRKVLKIGRKQGEHGKILNTSKIYTDDPIFEVVFRYVAKEITYAQAKQEIQERVFMGERTVERYIEDIRPRAEAAYKLMRQLDSKAEKPE